MLTKLSPKSGLVFLLAVGAAVQGSTLAAQADDLKTAQRRSDPVVTGAINPQGGVSAPAPVVSRARAALARFSEARAAMEHGLFLRETAPKSDRMTVDSNMKGLMEDLTAVEQMEQSRFAASAKEAKRLADDWYKSGMKIIAPPAAGVTELPVQMFVTSKAEAVATALDWLVEETAANTSTSAKVSPPPASAAMPVRAPMTKSAVALRPRHASRKAILAPAPKPISQSEATARLLRDGLPLLLPGVGPMLLRKDDASKR